MNSCYESENTWNQNIRLLFTYYLLNSGIIYDLDFVSICDLKPHNEFWTFPFSSSEQRSCSARSRWGITHFQTSGFGVINSINCLNSL